LLVAKNRKEVRRPELVFILEKGGTIEFGRMKKRELKGWEPGQWAGCWLDRVGEEWVGAKSA
jgi:hypothetical protein